MTQAEQIRATFDTSVETYPYPVGLDTVAADLMEKLIPDFAMEEIWKETEEALYKFSFTDGSELCLSVDGPEYGLDAYTYTIQVVQDPSRWLEDQILTVTAELSILSATLEQATIALAYLDGKLIRMIEVVDDEKVVRYLSEEEFLAEYKEHYEGRLIEHYRPTAEEYLADLKAGKADQVVNQRHIKMKAEWIRPSEGERSC